VNRSLAVGLLAVLLVAGLGFASAAAAGDDAVGSAADARAVDAVEDAGSVEAVGTAAGVEPVTLQDNGTEDGTDGDNETVRHRHPDDQGTDEGDLGGWLADRLGDRLDGGVIEISEGQYDRARDLLGEEYEERLGQFVDVTGNEEATEPLQESRDTQAELAALLEEFEETRAAYAQALAAGDAERARQLARELVALADRIESKSVELEELLAEVEETLDVDLGEATASVEEIRTDIQEERATIVEETLTETRLTVETGQERTSFLDPLAVTGRLRTAAGEPVANESIRLSVAGESVATETDAEGAFTAEYRPTTLPVGPQSVTARYVPAETSVYLASEDSVTVTVEQVEPTLSLTGAPDAVAFGDAVTVRGRLAVEDVPVDGVGLTVVLGGQELGTVTASNGTFEGQVTVPASVPAGNRTLAVRLPDADRALSGAADVRPVTVRETETALSVAATAREGSAGAGSASIAVNGTLATVDGAGIEGEPVDVRIGSETVATATTSAGGAFAETVAVPERIDGEEVTITVAYAGTGNLAPSQATEAVVLPSGGADGGSGTGGADSGQGAGSGSGTGGADSGAPATVVLLAVLLVAGLGAGGVWWYRRRGGGAPTPAEGETESSPEAPARAGTTAETGATESLLAEASDHLGAGRPDRAVQVGYAAVRDHLESGLGVSGPLTHWEFYRACRDATGEVGGTDAGGEGDADDTGETLRTVTEEYERAVYGIEDVPAETAQSVLVAARRLCGLETEGSRSESPADD